MSVFGPVQPVVPTDQYGTPATTVAGNLSVTDEPTTLFYDPFDSTLDTTNRWNTPVTSGGGVAATVSAGNLTIGSGTTASGYSYIQSQQSFTPTVPGYLGHSDVVKWESGTTITNGYRFTGRFSPQASPTTAAPILNGDGFEIDSTGKLNACVWSNGTKIFSVDLSSTGTNKQPTDGAFHRLIVRYRTDKTFFYIDTVDTNGLVATANFQAAQVQTLPVGYLCVAGSTPPTSSAAFTVAGVAVWDTAKNNQTLSDGQFPWRKLTIKTGNAAPTSTDLAAVVRPADYSVTGTITTGASNVALSTVGCATATLNVSGSWTTSLLSPILFQTTTDGTNWRQVTARYMPLGSPFTPTTPTNPYYLTTNGQYIINVGGCQQVRVLGPTATGTATITINASLASRSVLIDREDFMDDLQTLGAGSYVYNTEGWNTLSLYFYGTFSGASIFVEGLYGSTANGNWQPLGGSVAASTIVSGPTAKQFSIGGTSQFRVRVASAGSGSLNLTFTASKGLMQSGLPVTLYQNGQTLTLGSDGLVSSSVAATYSSLAGSIYNTTLPTPTNGQQTPAQSGPRGELLVSQLDGRRQTYSVGTTNAPAAAATDIFTIQGSATTTVRIHRIEVSATATTAGGVTLQLIRRSAANTGGISVTVTPGGVYDTNNNASTAVCLAYTTNPTALGTQVAILKASKLEAPLAGGAQVPIIWDFGVRGTQALVLRGTSQFIALNLNAGSLTGGSCSINIEWSEDVN